MKKILLLWFNTNNKSGYKTKEFWLKKHKLNLYNNILSFNKKYFTEQICFKQKVYNYIYQIKKIQM